MKRLGILILLAGCASIFGEGYTPDDARADLHLAWTFLDAAHRKGRIPADDWARYRVAKASIEQMIADYERDGGVNLRNALRAAIQELADAKLAAAVAAEGDRG